MQNEDQNLIDKLAAKYREFEKAGLLSYQKYLQNEFENAHKSDNKKAYTRYIEQELIKCQKRLDDNEAASK